MSLWIVVNFYCMNIKAANFYLLNVHVYVTLSMLWTMMCHVQNILLHLSKFKPLFRGSGPLIELPNELEMNCYGLVWTHCGSTAYGILHAITYVIILYIFITYLINISKIYLCRKLSFVFSAHQLFSFFLLFLFLLIYFYILRDVIGVIWLYIYVLGGA